MYFCLKCEQCTFWDTDHTGVRLCKMRCKSESTDIMCEPICSFEVLTSVCLIILGHAMHVRCSGWTFLLCHLCLNLLSTSWADVKISYPFSHCFAPLKGFDVCHFRFWWKGRLYYVMSNISKWRKLWRTKETRRIGWNRLMGYDGDSIISGWIFTRLFFISLWSVPVSDQPDSIRLCCRRWENRSNIYVTETRE